MIALQLSVFCNNLSYMVNYIVVLFKDKLKKKIINKFVTLKNAKDFYGKKLLISND